MAATGRLVHRRDASDGLLGEGSFGAGPDSSVLPYARWLDQREPSGAPCSTRFCVPRTGRPGSRSTTAVAGSRRFPLGNGGRDSLWPDAADPVEPAIGVRMWPQHRLHLAGRGPHDRPHHALQIPHEVQVSRAIRPCATTRGSRSRRRTGRGCPAAAKKKLAKSCFVYDEATGRTPVRWARRCPIGGKSTTSRRGRRPCGSTPARTARSCPLAGKCLDPKAAGPDDQP